MPYEWRHGTERAELVLWPHRSLPRRGFVIFIATTCVMFALPLLGVLGTSVLWGLLPFLLLAVAGVWYGLEHSYRTGRLREDLRISADQTHLTRSERGRVKDWACNTHWVRLGLHRNGPVPHYITLGGNGREVEIGAFLSEEERRRLHGELAARLEAAKRGDGFC